MEDKGDIKKVARLFFKIRWEQQQNRGAAQGINRGHLLEPRGWKSKSILPSQHGLVPANQKGC